MAINVATPEIKQELLSWKKKDMTMSFISKMFGSTSVKKDGKMIITPPKYDTTMILHLKAGEYINKEDITTTVGSFLFNKLLIEKRVDHIIPGGFYDGEITAGRFKELMSIIGNALKAGTIKIDPTLVGFLADYENYGLKLPSIFSPSYSMNIIRPNKDITRDKEKDISDADIKSVHDMSVLEDKWVKQAVGDLKGEPSMALYDSGARGSFSNNYKTMSIAVGAVENPATGEYDFVSSNLIDGLQKKDMVSAGNIVVTSEYPKAVGTQVGGYITKQFYAVFQSISVDKHGTDCGSKKYLEIVLTKDLVNPMMYQYIVDGNKLVALTDDNVDTYINKKVKFRTPIYCTSDKLCNKCAGERPYIVDIENIGLTAGIVSNTLLNASMKKRHDISVKMDNVNINTLII